MKFYLSSYKIGNKANILKQFFIFNKKIGIITNAVDYKTKQEIQESANRNKENLEALGLEPIVIDLKQYFHKQTELKQLINTLGGLWVRGGNTFILRQAMKLSGLDKILQEMHKDKTNQHSINFVYAGYSAGICILAPSLKGLHNVDNPNIMPYKEAKETIWEGLNIIDFLILPHYQSDHPESKDIDKDIAYCKENNIKFKPLRDGEVIVIE